MAKRHHSSHHAKMRHGGHSMGHAEYAGPLQKRALERMDGAMIHEDHSAMANLPQNVIMKYYPKCEYSTYELDDTMRGIDKQQHDDSRRDERRSSYEDGQY